MSRWAFWRTRPLAPSVDEQPGAVSAPRAQRQTDGYWLAEAFPTVLAWLLPSGAVVVSAFGQFLLAALLLTLALGVLLCLWCGRQRRPKAAHNS